MKVRVAGKHRAIAAIALCFAAQAAVGQSASRDASTARPAREDALDPTPVDPASDPDISLFLNDWRNAKPRTAYRQLVFHDILTKLSATDPVRPKARGAVLNAITAVSYVTLAPGATAAGRVRPTERLVLYTSQGVGRLSVNGKAHILRDGIGFTLTPDFDFRIDNTGKQPLAFYARAEPLPVNAEPSRDVVVVSRWDQDRRIGAHWLHICNGGPPGMTLCTIAPNTMPQPHSHAGEEAWILVKGESVLSLGKNLVRMHPGQAYKIPPTGLAAHSNLNLGDVPIEMIYLGPATRSATPPPAADFARLDNRPIDPASEPDIDMFMGNWRDAFPRIMHGNLYLRDMLTRQRGGDALHPIRRGAVLTNAEAVSYAMLEPGSTAHPVTGQLAGIQQVFVVASGTGSIMSGSRRFALTKGSAFVITPDLDFRLTATGDRYLTFYVVSENLAAPTRGGAALQVVNRQSTPPVTAAWFDQERPVITKADGLGQYGAITHVDLKPMAMARPYSAAAGVEEIWIAIDDVDLLMGKQLRRLRAGTAYKVPATGITAHANINLSGKTAEFLYMVK